MADVAIRTALETAEHNGARYGQTLIVFDTLSVDPFGFRVEVEPAASAVGGYCARAYDGVGKGCTTWSSSDDPVEAAQAALDAYFEIVNR